MDYMLANFLGKITVGGSSVGISSKKKNNNQGRFRRAKQVKKKSEK